MVDLDPFHPLTAEAKATRCQATEREIVTGNRYDSGQDLKGGCFLFSVVDIAL
jgi:hypothetical protein